MKNSSKNNGLVSVSWLAGEHHHDRATIARRLRGVPFVAGPKGAKMYDREVAAAAIESRDDDMATLVHERARRAEIEREIKQLQLDEKRAKMLPAEFLTNALAEMAVGLRSEIDAWPCTEACKAKCFLSIERAGIKLGKWMGVDTRKSERDLAARHKKLDADIAAGRIPDHWIDAHLPPNNRRVWSPELNRYFTKQEIIKKFGEVAQFSPIDEILEEEADGN
jgi:hypothetical protein